MAKTYVRFSRFTKMFLECKSFKDFFSALAAFVIRDSFQDFSVIFHLKHLYSSLFIIHVSHPYRAVGLRIVCFERLFCGVFSDYSVSELLQLFFF